MGVMGSRTSRGLVAGGVALTVVALVSWAILARHTATVGVGATVSASSGTPGASSTTPIPTSTRTAGPTVSPTSGPTAPRVTGGKPGPANTGVPPGVHLTVVNGDKTFDRAGTYSNLDIHGFVRVTARNVVLKNLVIRGGTPKCNSSVLYIVAGASATVEDSEIAPAHATACLDGVWATNVTLLRMNIHGAVDGVKAYDNTTIQDSYIHDLARFASDPNQNGGPTHNDAVQTYEGNEHITLRHNTFTLSNQDNATYQVTQDGGKKSTDLHIESNWLDGGGCTLNFSHNGGPTPMTGIYVVNNRFGRHSYFACPILVSTQTQLSQNSGNVWDDTGKPIPAPQRHD